MSRLTMDWDPEVESPASIAIIGAGPIGLEAALYARFLGYYVDLFEEHRIAGRIEAIEDTLPPIEIGLVTSSLGRSALLAQREGSCDFPINQSWTHRQWADEYLVPLARTDLLHDGVHIHSQVISVSRFRTNHGLISHQERANDEFRLMINSRHRGSWMSRADVVLDCTGWSHASVGLAAGGGTARGEPLFRNEVLFKIPRYEKILDQKHYVLVGSSEAAVATVKKIVATSRIKKEMRLTWLVPCDAIVSEVLNAKQEATQADLKFAFLSCLGVESIEREENGWRLQVLQTDDSLVELMADQLISLPTPVQNREFSLPLSRTWMESESSIDELTAREWPGSKLITSEPHYYRLGANRYPLEDFEGNPVRLPAMREEIRDLFALLGGRKDLDLYRTSSQ